MATVGVTLLPGGGTSGLAGDAHIVFGALTAGAPKPTDLVKAYRAGATISQLAVEFGIHRTTVAAHLDRHGVPRHSEQTACPSCHHGASRWTSD